MLIEDHELGLELGERQRHWIAQARRVGPERIAEWPLHWKIINNLMSVLAPIL